MKKSPEKFILDACCGGKMMWFQKNHPNALFIDTRRRPKGFMTERPNFEIAPDEIADFRALKYPDKSFKLVVWDPPHTIRRSGLESGVIAKRYGRLFSDTWEEDLALGFNECWRVLKPHGILIFKWGGKDKKVKEVLRLFSHAPLFGHTTDNLKNTHWMCFMKI